MKIRGHVVVRILKLAAAICISACLLTPAGLAEEGDADGVQEHPLLSRYPGQVITWQEIDNYREFRVPVGKVSGYRQIGEWIDTEGLVTRTFYTYRGEDRTVSEIHQNYLDALEAEGFEILGERYAPDRRGGDFASGSWVGVYVAANPWAKRGAVSTLVSGTSGSGGAGAIVATKDRAAGRIYVVINSEQHDTDYLGALIDIVEVETAETGLVVVDAEAIGKGIAEEGRIVLDGVLFDHNKATIKPESAEALQAVADFMGANPEMNFYVVGHTDSTGEFAYNMSLSRDRARAVADALKADYGIDGERIEGHGVGPLVPVFTNASEDGRARNRRVELVER